MIAHLLAVYALALPGSPLEAPFQDLTFDQALAAASKDGKVVMIDFFTTWCAPCKRLDKVTWKDPEVQKWLGEKTIALRMDAEKEVELAKRFAVSAYPSIVFVKPDGKQLDKIVGFMEPKEFLSEATDALAGKDAVQRAKEKVDAKVIDAKGKFVGHENDPMARGNYADALAEAGRYDDALAEYLWCFDHGVEADPGYVGVRVSFLLGDIGRLAKKHPPAMHALDEMRNKAESNILAGTASRDDLVVFTNVNDELKANNRTLALYDRLKKENRLNHESREALARKISEPLLEAKRYAELLEVVGDVQARVKMALEPRHYPDLPGLDDEDSKRATQMMEAMAKADQVKECSDWYEASLGAGRDEDAAAIADRVLEFAPTSGTYRTLIDRAVRAGANETARSLVARGLASLPSKDRWTVERAAKKIPAAK